ncbi:hypothetical protein [Stenomitos frigidus]|uniref:Lipoprotein n=1 Tax=Stenomitos frigidus ULC18 TaxID=2107698 RepID=A0A2T1E2S9_9CYAN|nr:hypothetical protein [Stenomitos frigidus]PSB27048.1 hypothetical protein C7B82_18050 [Stenomitos frigidus ULC18]
MKLIWVLSPLLLFVSTACSRLSAKDVTSEHLKTIGSWTATAQMVAESWAKGSVLQPYAKQTLEKTQQEIAKETESLFQELPQTRSQLAPPLQQLQQTIQQLSIAVDQPEKTAITAPLKQLMAEEKQLQTLIQSQSKTP